MYDPVGGAECYSSHVATKENAMQRHLPSHSITNLTRHLTKNLKLFFSNRFLKNLKCQVELVIYDPIGSAECHSSQVSMEENVMQRHLPGCIRTSSTRHLTKNFQSFFCQHFFELIFHLLL